MKNPEREVLVIRTIKLFGLISYFQGFSLLPADILATIEANAQWLNKERAENDPNFKQLIGYTTIINPDNQVFAYQRASKNSKYQEKRLQGKWSIGIGGHVERSLAEEKISASIRREIAEEIETFNGIQEITLLGGINDDSNDVGKVHFGIFLLATTSSRKAIPKDAEIDFGEFKTLEEIVQLFKTGAAENWSQICLPHIPHV